MIRNEISILLVVVCLEYMRVSKRTTAIAVINRINPKRQQQNFKKRINANIVLFLLKRCKSVTEPSSDNESRLLILIDDKVFDLLSCNIGAEFRM